jgi:hypothetical protein
MSEGIQEQSGDKKDVLDRLEGVAWIDLYMNIK